MYGQDKSTGKSKSPRQDTFTWRKNTPSTDGIDWGQLDAVQLRLLIDAVARAGAAVIFGKTSDGGALSIVVLCDDQKIKEYPHTVQEATDLVAALTEHFVSLIAL